MEVEIFVRNEPFFELFLEHISPNANGYEQKNNEKIHSEIELEKIYNDIQLEKI